MTDTNAPSGEPTLVERAHLMLAQAARWGHLTDDEQLQVMAGGGSTGKQQAMALNYAGALALVAAAESLALIAHYLGDVAEGMEDVAEGMEAVAVWVNQTGPGR